MAEPLQRAENLARSSARRVSERVGQGARWADAQVGGPARRRAVIMLACVLALDTADKGAIGALAAPLQRVLHIGPARLGLLVTVSSAVGALATVPVGALTDRTRRVRLLVASIVVWGVAEAFSGAAVSYLMLLGTRVALGAVTATAGPTVASLTGDLFPARQRARMYGFIITGEMVGAGIGVLVAGLLSKWIDWRAAFFALGAPSLVLAYLLHRKLPEPARGGQSRIGDGEERILPAREAGRRRGARPDGAGPPERDDVVVQQVVDRGVEPAEDIVLDEEPGRRDLRGAVRYVLSVRTNLILILGSGLGYFFLSGLRTFAVVFARGQYGVGQGVATVLVLVVGAGAVAGLILGGGITDRLVGRGRINARVLVGALGFAVAALVLIPGLFSHHLYVAVPAFVVAAAFIAAPNPGLDAARLDVLPSYLWGRGEGVRTFLRQLLEAFAPLTFGVVAAEFGGRRLGFGAAAATVKNAAVSAAETHGLQLTFLIMLAPLAAAGLLLWVARRYYPTDVASAAESERRGRRRPAPTAPRRETPS